MKRTVLTLTAQIVTVDGTQTEDGKRDRLQKQCEAVAAVLRNEGWSVEAKMVTTFGEASE